MAILVAFLNSTLIALRSLVPRLFCVGGEKKEPGIHCLRMRQIAPEFRRDWELSFTFAIRVYVGVRHLAKAKLSLVRRSPIIRARTDYVMTVIIKVADSLVPGVHGRRKERLVSAVCARAKLTFFIAQLFCILTQP